VVNTTIPLCRAGKHAEYRSCYGCATAAGPGSITALEVLGNIRISKVARIALAGLLTLALVTLLADPATAPAKKKGSGLSKRFPKPGLWKGSLNYVSQGTGLDAGQLPLSFRLASDAGVSDFTFRLPEPPHCSQGNPPPWWPYPLPTSTGVSVPEPYGGNEDGRFVIQAFPPAFRLDSYSTPEGVRSIFADGFLAGEFQGRTKVAGMLTLFSDPYAVSGTRSDCTYFLGTSWSASLKQKKKRKGKK
jgi:hypothetical protein